MDLDEKKIDQKVTVGNAVPYCQHCLNKSNETFQINSNESIRICLNMTCTKSDKAKLNSVITYDCNKNGDNEISLFKYSNEIKKMNSKELMNFFEKDLNSVTFYQDLSSIFTELLAEKKENSSVDMTEMVII